MVVCCFGLIQFSYSQQLQVKLSPQLKQGAYHISCAGQSNGAIQSLIIGGKSPYTYHWNDNVTSANRTGLPAGTYILTVTDSNLVQAADTVILLEPQALTLSSQISSYPGGFAVSQFGQNDGSIQVLVSGGVPPYTYAWNSGANQAIISAVTPGNYSCLVSDAAGCTNSANQSLNAPSQLTAAVSIQQHVTCNGNNDGAAIVIVTGGVRPYQYRWLSSESDSVASSLPRGVQKVDIKDRNGAELRVTFEINEPEEFKADIQIPVYPNGYEVSCNGCYNGVVTIAGNGGTAPYSILWSDSVSSFSRTQLGGGKLAFKLSDSHGCEVREYLKLSEPERDDWSKSGNTGVDPSNQFIGTTDASPIAFKANNQEVMRIAENGNIGIGTNTPEYKFDVDGNVRLKQQVNMESISLIPPNLTSAELALMSPLILNADGLVKKANLELFAQYVEAINVGECLERNNGIITTWQYLPAPSTGDKKIIYAGSEPVCAPRVGIGTNNPQADLHVIGNTIVNGNTSVYGHVSQSSSVIGTFGEAENGTLLTIQASNLQDGASSVTINHTNQQDYSYSFLNNVNKDKTKAFVVKNTVTNRENFIVLGDGTTVIGDPNDGNDFTQTKLGVYGMIAARRFRVTTQTPFPDYVFDENYDLRNIDELKNYITLNKHLPGLVSAQEVEKNEGYLIEELQLKSLEKIEELTLYIIDLHERIKVLEEKSKKIKE